MIRSTVLTLVAKDFRLFWNDRMAVILTFLVPMVLMTIFGLIFGGFGDGGMSGVRLMVVDQAQTPASGSMIEALQQEPGLEIVTDYQGSTGDAHEMLPLSEAVARDRLANDASNWRFVLLFPPDFAKESFGFRLHYLYNARSEVEFQIVSGLVQRTFFANALPLLQKQLSELKPARDPAAIGKFQDRVARAVSDTFALPYEAVRGSFSAGSVLPDFGAVTGSNDRSGGGNDPFSLLLELNDEQIAGKGKPPAAQSVGSWAVIFLLFTLTGAASALFEERDQGLFQRLLAGPVSHSQILWSKYVYLALLGLLQLAVLMSFGQLVFKVITSAAQLLPLLVICTAGAAASTAFGMVLCAFCRTPAQASGLGTLFILSMSALGGAMVPAFLFPAFVRDYVSPLSLVYWMMDGILQVLWEDASVAALSLNLLVLGAFSVVALSLAQWRFRRGDLFRQSA